MPAVSVRVSALDEVGDRDAPVGSKPWALWVVGQAKLQRDELERDASALRRLIGKMQKHEAWKALGVPSFDMLCATQLRLSSEEVSAVLKARKGQSVGTVLRRVGPTGRPPKGTTLVPLSTGGNDRIKSQIATRRPDIAERMAAGEFASVRQAAIAAGIVKVPSVLDQLRKLWAKASEADRRKFMEEASDGR
jgi:hypothetical protein